MNSSKFKARFRRPLVAIAAVTAASAAAWAFAGVAPIILIGNDANNFANPFVQPQDPALSGGGRDQTQQFGDVIISPNYPTVQIGLLGVDTLLGGGRDDVIVGGPEHFNPANRDKAFGGTGKDIFLWSPGDGSDRFDGGPGVDAVVFGLMGEVVNDQLTFQVSNDQLAGDVYINPLTSLPLMDVTNSPGFCEVIDASSSANAQTELDELGVDHLVQFFIRGVADAFESGAQTTDNGLRVTLHLKDVEVLVCTDRNGGVIEVFNMTVSPPQSVPLAWAVNRVPALGAIVQ